jgi:hypothetical protein
MHIYIYVYDSLTLKLLSLTLIGVLFEERGLDCCEQLFVPFFLKGGRV